MIELLCLISNEKEDKIIKPLYNKYDKKSSTMKKVK